MKETQLQSSVTTRRQIIIPRKGVNELVGLLESGDGRSSWSLAAIICACVAAMSFSPPS
jgi:hypothetical protein